MKYTVSMAIIGRVDVEVEANSFEEAKCKAYSEACDIDFGSIEDIVDMDAVNAEDEDGNFVDY